jgi:hypothetical protein
MKLISVIFTAALLSLVEACFAQGFINLNFESASFVPGGPNGYSGVQFAQAFPGWTGTVGGTPQTGALYNNVFLDSAGISIIDHGWAASNWFGFPGGLIQGKYTAIHQSGNSLDTGQPADTTLSQAGRFRRAHSHCSSKLMRSLTH